MVVDQDGGFLFDAKPLPYAPHPCVDEFTDLGRAVLEDSLPCVRVASGPGLFQVGALLVAALLSGVGEAARDQSATYAQERKQFGRPIGVYQAIKHPCANMAVRSEAAWSQVAYSALALRAGHADAGFQISAAKRLAGEAALENASANVQVHGGYGLRQSTTHTCLSSVRTYSMPLRVPPDSIYSAYSNLSRSVRRWDES